jgi:hypothetical protein
MAYSEKDKTKIVNDICKRISEGESLRSVLRYKNMPVSDTLYKWLDADEEKALQYARACEERADYIFDEIIEIADTPVEGKVIETDDNGRTKEKVGDMLGHRKLQIDARKWMLSKMNPKKYGDKLDLAHSGEIKTTNLENVPTEELIKRAEAVKKLSNDKT